MNRHGHEPDHWVWLLVDVVAGIVAVVLLVVMTVRLVAAWF